LSRGISKSGICAPYDGCPIAVVIVTEYHRLWYRKKVDTRRGAHGSDHQD
jgi:hypothetical protein